MSKVPIFSKFFLILNLPIPTSITPPTPSSTSANSWVLEHHFFVLENSKARVLIPPCQLLAHQLLLMSVSSKFPFIWLEIFLITSDFTHSISSCSLQDLDSTVGGSQWSMNRAAALNLVDHGQIIPDSLYSSWCPGLEWPPIQLTCLSCIRPIFCFPSLCEVNTPLRGWVGGAYNFSLPRVFFVVSIHELPS